MKRVAILHFAAPPIVGGVESTIFHHARLLNTSGYRVDVIAGRGSQFHPQVAFHHIPEVDSRHPDVLAVGEELSAGEVTAKFKALRNSLADQLRPVLTNSKASIVHNALTLHKNLALTAALQQLNDEEDLHLIAWCHDFAWQDPLYTPDLHPGYPWDLLRTAWSGVQYVAVSEHRRGQLADLLGVDPERVKVVTPGVDIYEFLGINALTQKLAETLNLTEADPLLLLPARITRRKNIQFAIRVTGALKPNRPKAALVVTGPPGAHNPKNQAYLESLLQLRDDLGIRNQVHFLYEQGEDDQPLYISDEDIAGMFRLSDLLLFPSRREGFGIPVLEAGLVRLPVFAADIPPVQESAGDFAMRFDPEGDPQQVAQAILEFLQTDKAYQLKQRVVKNFTWRAILVKKLIPLIEESRTNEKN